MGRLNSSLRHAGDGRTSLVTPGASGFFISSNPLALFIPGSFSVTHLIPFQYPISDSIQTIMWQRCSLWYPIGFSGNNVNRNICHYHLVSFLCNRAAPLSTLNRCPALFPVVYLWNFCFGFIWGTFNISFISGLPVFLLGKLMFISFDQLWSLNKLTRFPTIVSQ